MSVEAWIYVVWQSVAAIIAATAAIYIWGRRSAPGAMYLMLMMCGATIWALTEAVEFYIPYFAAKVICSKLSYVGIVMIPPCWLLFAFQYSGRYTRLSGYKTLWLWVWPVVTVLLVWTNEWHRLVWPTLTALSDDPNSIIQYGHGPFFFANAAYGYALLLVGTWSLLHGTMRSVQPFKRQFWVLVFAILIPWITNSAYVLRITPLPYVDLTTMAFAWSGLLIAWSIYRWRLLDLMPIAHDLLFRELPDAALVLDSQERLVDMNRAAQKMLGLRAADAGQGISAVLSRWPTLQHACISAAGHSVVETRLNDGAVWLDISITAIHEPHGMPSGRILLIRDITEQQNARQEQRLMEQRLWQTQKLESLGVMAGGIAHDFNNLLQIISGCTELLQDKLDSQRQEQIWLAQIKSATDRASSIAAQMRSYVGKDPGVVRPVNLSKLVEEMMGLLHASAPTNAAIAFDLDPGLPPVNGDISQLQQVLLNLVVNAWEALDSKAGAIQVRTGLRWCDASTLSGAWSKASIREGRYVYMEVEDTGHGIDAESRANLFDPFFTTKFAGRGLGLAAALGIIRGHNGAITVQSRPGTSTVFTVYLAPA